MAEMGPGLFSWSVQSGPELTQFGEYIKILGILGSQGTSLGFQLLGLRTSTAWGTGSIPGRRTRIPHAAWCSQKKKKKSQKKELSQPVEQSCFVEEVTIWLSGC